MLKQLIINLYEAVNNKTASDDIHSLIDDLLEENDLIDPNKVPNWFVEFIKNIIAKQPVDKTYYKYDSSKGDISNFIAGLEDLIDADWNDYGEAIEVDFTNLNIHAYISSEGNYYEIICIKNKFA
jgi:hypothetical protein